MNNQQNQVIAPSPGVGPGGNINPNTVYRQPNTTELQVHSNPEPTINLAGVQATINTYNLRDYVNVIRDNIAKISQIRRQTVEARIREVFMEIDQLGHYTDSNWFFNLDRRRLYIFYIELTNIWQVRAQLTLDTKYRICPYDPFLRAFPSILGGHNLEQMRLGCLRIIENMVYMGIDRDFKNLGAFHILTSLTIVSLEARQTMPWLYDSVI